MNIDPFIDPPKTDYALRMSPPDGMISPDEDCKCPSLVPVMVLGCMIVTGIAFLIGVLALVWYLLGT